MRFSVILWALPLGLAAHPKRAVLLQPRDDAQLIADKYIVKLKDGASTASFDKSFLPSADHIFKGIFNGFSATLKEDALEALLTDPNVHLPLRN